MNLSRRAFCSRFESGAMRFSGGKSIRAVQKIDSILVLLLRGTVNRELRIAQNTTSETKGRLFTVGKVSTQNVYLTLTHAHI